MYSSASKHPSPIPNYNTSDDDESEDEYGARPSHKPRKKRRRVTVTNDTPPAEVRFSTRRAGKVTNYNEDDEDDFEEEGITPAYDYQDPEPDIGGIDLVLDHRPRDGVGMFCFWEFFFSSLIKSLGASKPVVRRADLEFHVCYF